MDEISQRLGDFEIRREIGRGGMGIVYEARQISLNRPVALKVLSGGLGLTTKAVQRFRREAEAAAKLHHTNIVPVYATGEQNGSHFYAMELIEGPSLDHVIRQLRQGKDPVAQDEKKPRNADQAEFDDLGATGPYVANCPVAGTSAALNSSSLSSGSAYFDTVARLMAEVADALEYAHQQGVIHRDIKPSNLLLAQAGRLSVNDFGLARMLEQPGMTMTGEFIGTPAYMSPEQITAGRTPLDHRTDIYSLGATLYELLALQPPFRGEQRDQVLAQILHKEPKPPRKVNPKVPVDLETICLKAMEKDPDRRYQSAGALAEDLRRYVNRFAILARRAGPVQRLAKWVRRRPALASTLAIACLLALTAASFAYHGYRTKQALLAEKQEQEEQLANERRQNALERALLAAMSGELDAAEKAIQEAERQGVSTGQVRLLRGELAYYRGNVNDAIAHLEQAVKLLPVEESAAARGLLTTAYVYAMRREEAARELLELDPIKPVSVEDFVLKGTAISQFDEERGLELLDQAVKLRPSSAIARLFRSDTLANLAANRANPEKADRAIEDAETAKRLLGETNPVAVWYCAGAYLLGAHVYKAAGQEEKYQKTRLLALQAAEALEPFKQMPDAAFVRMIVAWYFGQKDRSLDELRTLAQQLDRPVISYCYALLLCWRGSSPDLQEVRQVLKGPSGNYALDFLLYMAVAELDGPEAVIKLLPSENVPINYGASRVFYDSSPLLLGKLEMSRVASRADRERKFFFPANQEAFFRAVLNYMAGMGSENAVFQAAAGSQRDESEAHYFVGMMRLAEGDRPKAREHFQRAITTSFPSNHSYDFSVVILARLDRDPKWPPWIPAKK